MSPSVRRAALVLALVAGAACAEHPSPMEPGSGSGAPGAPPAAVQAAADQRSRHERLARAFALALRDRDFRLAVFDALAASRVREGKVHLQQFLMLEHGKQRHRLAGLAEQAEAVLAADLDQSAPIEIYLPVPAHRGTWRGDDDLLVATAETDRDIPVAYDPKGKRLLLDPDRPPAVPVIALQRAEVDFGSAGPAAAICAECAGDGTGGGSGSGSGSGSASAQSPGLYLTYAQFNSTFEGWLKGAPEFETHVLGQDGGSNAMRSYQCAGESAGIPYQYNQDDKIWRGSVLLFSQAQLDAYKAAHPGQALRVFVVEDDDAPCVIKTDSARVTKLFQQLVATYGVWTAGKDTLISMKTYRKAASLLALLKSAWSVLASQDELVGNAIEDSVAAEYFTGANWIVKGDNTVTNGAIRLEMR
jgi:hypothetical protein